MPAWNKIKFFWDNIFGISGGTLTATSTATGYDVANIHNGLEINGWKATSTTGQLIKIDTYSVDTAADAIIIGAGHNLATIGAAVTLSKSTTGAWSGEQVTVATLTVVAGAILKEFAQTTSRYWGLWIDGTPSAAAEIQTAMLCAKTELDYASTSFDPHGQTIQADVNITQGGYCSGIHTRYTEREMSLNFNDADSALYAKITAWRDGNGMKQFFVAWENANSPSDVFLMRPDGSFKNPLTNGGAYRDITINLKGRKA